jgi:hypothetical protein
LLSAADLLVLSIFPCLTKIHIGRTALELTVEAYPLPVIQMGLIRHLSALGLILMTYPLD